MFLGMLPVFGGVFCLLGGVLVDAGDEFGCCLDVFCVLVAVLLGEHFFFVSYPVVEEGYPCEGYEESREAGGV